VFGIRSSVFDNALVDRQYRTMMVWVLAAVVATLIAAYFIVEWTVNRYGG